MNCQDKHEENGVLYYLLQAQWYHKCTRQEINHLFIQADFTSRLTGS